jgi:hypothetical protein
MGFYMYQGCFTAEGFKGAIAKPNDRLIPLTAEAGKAKHIAPQ